MSKLFSEWSLRVGKRLFNNKQVYDLERDGSTIRAIVRDKGDYDVTFKLNNQNKIIEMQCDCQESKNCIHKAAVLYAIQDAQLLNKVEKKEEVKENNPISYKSTTIDDLYHEIRSYYKRDKDIHKAFMKELNNRCLNIDDIDSIINYISQYSRIKNYPKAYRNQVTGFFKTQLKDLAFNKDNAKALLSWLMDCYQYGENMEYNFLFLQVLENLSPDDQIIYLGRYINDLLLINGELDSLMDVYFKKVKDYNYPIIKALNHVNNRDNHVLYKYYEINNLIAYNNIESAKKIYDKYTRNKYLKNHSLMQELGSIISSRYKNIPEKIKSTIRKLKRSRYYELEDDYIYELKRYCDDQWDDYKYIFYDQLTHEFDPRILVDYFEKENEWEYLVKNIAVSKDISDIYEYNFISRQHKELYFVLYMKCLENFIKQNIYFMDYMLLEYIEELKDLKYSNDAIEEGLYVLMEKCNKDSRVYGILNNYIEKRLNND